MFGWVSTSVSQMEVGLYVDWVEQQQPSILTITDSNDLVHKYQSFHVICNQQELKLFCKCLIDDSEMGFLVH